MALRLVVFLCVAVGFFGVGYEAAHGAHALYEHWYCLSPIAVLGLGGLLRFLGRGRLA